MEFGCESKKTYMKTYQSKWWRTGTWISAVGPQKTQWSKRRCSVWRDYRNHMVRFCRSSDTCPLGEKMLNFGIGWGDAYCLMSWIWMHFYSLKNTFKMGSISYQLQSELMGILWGFIWFKMPENEPEYFIRTKTIP